MRRIATFRPVAESLAEDEPRPAADAFGMPRRAAVDRDDLP